MVQGRQIGSGDLEEMGTMFCVGLQRLDEHSGSAGFDEENKDSVEYMSCHSDSRYLVLQICYCHEEAILL